MSRLPGVRVAYLCLQATTPGQASYAHVHEIVAGLRDAGAHVELFEPSYAGGHAPGALGRLAEFGRVQRRLVSRLHAFDVLYIRGHPLAWPAARAARGRRMPVVQECNGIVDDFVLAWPAARPLRGLLSWLSLGQFRTATALIAGSQGLAGWLERETGRAAHVVPNGANAEVFKPSPRPEEPLPDRYAVFFGSLGPWQGIGTSLKAVSSPAWPEGVSLVLVGAGAMQAEVRAAAASDGRILYLGPRPYRSLAPIVSNAVCSLLNKEAAEFEQAGISPLKLYESMACGVPVVATERMPGLTEIVEGQHTGVVVPQRDPEALAAAVANLAEDATLRAALGDRGRSYVVAEATWQARAEETARIIASAVGEAGAQEYHQ